MSVSEEKIPVKINWTGDELDAVIKMLQIFPLALKKQNLESCYNTEEREKYDGWTSEQLLKSEWFEYNFDLSDINKARGALGRFGLIKSRTRGQVKQGGFGHIYLHLDVDNVTRILSTYQIEIPELPPLLTPVDVCGSDSTAEDEEIDIADFYEEGNINLHIPEKKRPKLTPLSRSEVKEELLETELKENNPLGINSKVRKLLQWKLQGKDKLLVGLWRLGNGHPVSRRAIRESMRTQLAELALVATPFSNAIKSAAEDGLIKLDGENTEYNSQLLTPLCDLDYLIDFYERREKEEEINEPKRVFPTPSDRDNPQIVALMQGSLTGAQKILLATWMFGGEGVELWALRETAIINGLLSNNTAFGISFKAAKDKGLVRIEGTGETTTIMPVIDLDTLTQQVKKPKGRITKEPVRPESIDPQVQELLKDNSLNDVEKLLICLWQFGPQGTERWNLRALVKENSEEYGIDFTRFAAFVIDAAKSRKRRLELIEVVHAEKPDNDIIRPILSLDDLVEGKHIIRKPKQPKPVSKRIPKAPEPNSEIIRLLKSGDFSEQENLLLYLLQYGPEGIDRWSLRDQFRADARNTGFKAGAITVTIRKAVSGTKTHKPLINIIPAENYNKEVLRPLFTLEQFKKGVHRISRTPVKPFANNGTLIDYLARFGLTQSEKVLVVLWKFGGKEVDRFSFKEAMRHEDKSLKLESQVLTQAICTAVYNRLVQIKRNDSPKDDLLTPLVGLDQLKRKYAKKNSKQETLTFETDSPETSVRFNNKKGIVYVGHRKADILLSPLEKGVRRKVTINIEDIYED